MSFTRGEKDGKTRLKIEGPMSIYEAPALRRELLSCLESESGLELDLGGVTDCDAAGLQLLYAAHKTAEKGKRPFRVSDVPQTVLETMRRAGLNPGEILGREVLEQ